MNTEDRLRRASQEIDRATSSLTPPSIGQVRRSARLRNFGVAAAAAVGAIVLVGGAVLALSPGGESLPGPAGPSETTTTTTTAESESTIEEPQASSDTTVPSATGAPCSGAYSYPDSQPLENLPEPVFEAVRKIIDAAAACDFDALAAVGGDNLTASFGGGSAAEVWTYNEEQGDEPMRWLLSILDLPNGIIETENGDLYVWPAAHAHQGDWETMPEADLEALRTLFTEEEIQGFAEFGGYIGYRVGIWENGDWSFFVAGD